MKKSGVRDTGICTLVFLYLSALSVVSSTHFVELPRGAAISAPASILAVILVQKGLSKFVFLGCSIAVLLWHIIFYRWQFEWDFLFSTAFLLTGLSLRWFLFKLSCSP